jgi:outer membrane protein assembly factor BamB
MSAYGSGDASTQAVLAVNPSVLSFAALQGGPAPAPAQLSVTNAGAGQLDFTSSTDAPWLAATPSSGTAPQSVQVSAATGGLAVGTYTGNVTIAAPGAQGSPKTVPVTLTVAPPGSSSDWVTVDANPGRTGEAAAEGTISPTSAPNLAPAWSTPVDGKVTAQPLYLKGMQVAGTLHDVLVVGTAANSVYALDANSGAVLWRRNFGTQPGNCAIPGGFGVTGAPVVDRASGRVYAVSNDGLLRTMSLTDGTDAAPALAVVNGPTTNKVWGGLNLVNGGLYIATASDGCDTQPWRGAIFHRKSPWKPWEKFSS